jgi:hypothetical protein
VFYSPNGVVPKTAGVVSSRGRSSPNNKNGSVRRRQKTTTCGFSVDAVAAPTPNRTG